MFGSKTRPTPARLLIAAIVTPICVWGVLKLSVNGWVDAAVDGMGEENALSYSSTFYDWHGNFGVRDARLVHSLPDGSEVAFLVDRITVHPPGFWWLFRNAWYRTSRDVPDEVSLTLENARNAADDNDTPGNYSNLPYDSTGCGETQLTPADYVTMGLPRPARNSTIGLTAIDDARSRLHFAMETPGSGDLAMDFDLDYPRPVKWRDILVTLQAAPIRHIAMTMRDTGFVRARNTYCAGRAGVAVAAFPDYSAGVLAKRLQATRQDFSAPVWDRYRRFVANGGRIELSTNAERPVTLWSFITMDREHKFRAFPMQLGLDGGSRIAFGYDGAGMPGPAMTTPGTAIAAVAPAKAAPVAAGAATADAPAKQAAGAPARPLAAPAPVPATAVAQARSGLHYRDLEHLVGSHVEVLTTNGTTRRGTLVAYATLMSNLRLDREEGGFMLALPADSITGVTLLAAAATPFQAVPDAKTH
jgi:hypothetical protein